MDTFPMHWIGLGVAWRLCLDEFVAKFGGTGADLALLETMSLSVWGPNGGTKCSWTVP